MAYWITGSSALCNDTTTAPTKPIISSDPNTITNTFDNFRQGTELKNLSHLYGSSQPKIWGGTVDAFGVLSHQQDFNTLGQASSFTEFFGSISQEDPFVDNIITHLVSGTTPGWMNGGPQRQFEAVMEPLPIPFKLPSTEGAMTARGTHGSWDVENLQIISDTIVLPFLDQGEERFGEAFGGSVILPGFASSVPTRTNAFTDTSAEAVFGSLLTNPDQLLLNVFLEMSGSGMTAGVQEPRGTSGYVCYGPNNARYRTDSLAFVGRIRGS